SGSKRITSSVTPGRMVGLIMPTTPRQLEKPITDFLVGGKPELGKATPLTRRNPSSPRLPRHIPRLYRGQAKRDRVGGDRHSRHRLRFAAESARPFASHSVPKASRLPARCRVR